MLPFFIQITDIVEVEKKSNDVLFGSYPQFKKKNEKPWIKKQLATSPQSLLI